MTHNVYSEFEVREQYIKVAGENSFSSMSCVGSSEEELEVKIVTKNCKGVREKERVAGTGNGTLTQSLHVPYAIYNKIYAMGSDNTLKDGVYGYGTKSIHPEFALTQKVIDEDGVVKFKAYPRCKIQSGPSRPITNGQEEVPELSLTISIYPDTYGYGMYEALEDDLSGDAKTSWLSSFTPALVHTTETTDTTPETI